MNRERQHHETTGHPTPDTRHPTLDTRHLTPDTRHSTPDTRHPTPDTDNDFFERVWDVAARIPEGRVTTYGHIAEFLGVKSAARTVGWALSAAKGSGLPAHRVVNRFGGLSGRLHFESPTAMEERLRSEGVTFDDDGTVKLEDHLWVPE